MNKPKVIAIVGPTGSGKSALGTYLAQKLGGEIISADSRQVYRGMRVISRAERGHMVGVADPKRQYSAGDFKKQADRILRYIVVNKKVPIVVGGTGFYIDILLGRMHAPEVPPDKKLRARMHKLTTGQLYLQLKKLDPVSATRIDPHNKVRLVRAIEIAKALGKVPQGETLRKYGVLWIGLQKQKNLKAGVEARLRADMVAEAKKLRTVLSNKRYAELGFEFDLLAQYIDKKITKAELVEGLVHGEQRYAKRQWRWFKRNKDIVWVKSPGRAGKTQSLRLAKAFLSR